jgi:protein TonB
MKFVTAAESGCSHRSIFPDLVSTVASRAVSENPASNIDDSRQRLSGADVARGRGAVAATCSAALHAAVLGACLAVTALRPEPPMPPAEISIELVTLATEPPPAPPESETMPTQPDAMPSLPPESPAVAEAVAPAAVIAPAPSPPPEKLAVSKARPSVPGPKPLRVHMSFAHPPASLPTPAPDAAAGAPVAAPRLPPDYAGLITARLLAVKRYPPQARVHREEGTILISMMLAADGSVISTHISQSSGVTSLDTEGLAMVARAAPFPPLPETFKASPLALIVPVTFSLRAE